jgi:lipopolysaccharide/colanic/teichoic acid biosynthesis glycosyltransferase
MSKLTAAGSAADFAMDEEEVGFVVPAVVSGGDIKGLSENRRGLAQFAQSSEQIVPAPLPESGSRIGAISSIGIDRAGLSMCARIRRLAGIRRDQRVRSALVGEFAADLANGPEEPAAVELGQAAGVGGAFCGAVSPCPWWKRTIDVAGASVGAIVLSPLYLTAAILIKCVSRGPVFFRQQRIGAGGRPFVLWKFRTIEMGDGDAASSAHHAHIASLMDADEPLTKLDRQLKVIPGGRALRRLGIDELPQLLNVLRGEMSLVGPRPDVVPYGDYEPWQRRRFDVLPGITGLWQVSGKNNTTFTAMMRLDVTYVERRSLWLDLAILAKTIPAVLGNTN